jgi:uncharacterized protein
MKKRYCLVLSFLLLAMPAVGQDRPANQEKLDNIRRLLTVTGSEKLQQNVMDQFMGALKTILTASVQGNQRGERILVRMTELLAEEMKKADFSRITVELYDKYFTNEDIKGLIQFYESPVGQKAVQLLPTLAQESIARGMEAGQLAGQRAMARLADEFPELKTGPGTRERN